MTTISEAIGRAFKRAAAGISRAYGLAPERPAVIEVRDRATGVATFEIWYRGGEPDREDGPALIERDPATGVATFEIWYRDGKLHREGGPAHIERDPATDAVVRTKWYRDGKRRPAAKGPMPPAH